MTHNFLNLRMNIRFLSRRNLDRLSDQELVTAFQQTGRERYFNELFERYYPLIFTRCLSLTAQREDSKDLTLIIFTKAHQFLQQSTVAHLQNWLFTLAKNECFNFLRLQRNKQRVARRWWEEHAPPVWLENEYFRRQLYEEQLKEDELFQTALQQLSEAQRHCLELFTWELKSYQDIADELALDTKQVKSHLQNARRRLKRWVAEHNSSAHEE